MSKSLSLQEYLTLPEGKRLAFVKSLLEKVAELEARQHQARKPPATPEESAIVASVSDPQVAGENRDSTRLSDAEIQLQRVLANVIDYAIFMLDRDGTVRTWNAGAERIKGYTAKEIVGKSFHCFYTPQDREAGIPEQALAKAIRDGHCEMESWRLRKDGSQFWANVHISAIKNDADAVSGFVKVTRDMTERRNFEEQLRQSQKMDAVGQLTGGVAHDFNNLLTVILGNLEKIARLAIHQEVRDTALRAIESAERAAKLTRQLLAFSRRQPLNPKPINIEQFVVSTAEMLRRTLGENIRIKTSLSGHWRCEVDTAQLESAILNLAVNARDAMPNGGELLLDVSNVRADRKMVAGTFITGEFVVICVSDTGTGMSKEVRDKAMEPFFTTKPIGEGTGLGLSQVYGFVSQSGGYLDVYSEEGYGTTIKLYLPRSLAEPPQPESSALHQALHGDESILLVEDEDSVRSYCAEILREFGYSVTECSNASSAMKKLAEVASVDLLLTDLGLPGVHGSELAQKVRSIHPQLPVLFISGYAADTLLQRGRIPPDAELLEKPFSRTDLARRVREVLNRSESSPHPRVLVVEDELLLQRMIVELLSSFGMETIAASTVSEAMTRSTPLPDLALIDLRLADGSGLEVIESLRTQQPQLPIIVASGYGERAPELHKFVSDPKTLILAKPYSLEALKEALSTLGFSTEISRV